MKLNLGKRGGDMEIKISKRKLESYKRAEKVCQELRYQIAHAQRMNMESVSNFLIKWMDKTGNLKYERPK